MTHLDNYLEMSEDLISDILEGLIKPHHKLQVLRNDQGIIITWYYAPEVMEELMAEFPSDKDKLYRKYKSQNRLELISQEALLDELREGMEQGIEYYKETEKCLNKKHRS